MFYYYFLRRLFDNLIKIKTVNLVKRSNYRQIYLEENDFIIFKNASLTFAEGMLASMGIVVFE